MKSIHFATMFILAHAYCTGATEVSYQVLDPAKSRHLHESTHFVVRWNDSDEVILSEKDLQKGLETLESILDFYLNTVGFPAPYAGQAEKYKINVHLSNKGWANGSGTGINDPAMWVNYKAFKNPYTMAHELAHCIQFSTMGLRKSPYVGWSWESQAEWMAHQIYPDQVGCSQQLLNATHLYYGSTRNRYGNWQFWEYIKDTFGYAAITDIWTKALKPGTPASALEDPLLVLARNQGWDTSALNDQFGLWAMHNVTWDYKHGDVFRKRYGSVDDCSGIRRNRVAILEPVESQNGHYAIPNYRAPQRFGYNLVRIDPEGTGASRVVTVNFQGRVQRQPGVARFDHLFENEPRSVPPPSSDWRWGLVAVDDRGNPRYSSLQRGAAAEVTFALRENEKQLWLVVVATPSEYQRIAWDQMYYSIYRFPWMVEIRGGHPRGRNPVPPVKGGGRQGAPHANGGGWVDATAYAAPSAYVGPAARVLDHAQVLGNARIKDQAVVSANARVGDNAVVCGHALITGHGIIGGHALIEQEAAVYGGRIDEEARLGALTLIEGDKTWVHGHAYIAAVMNAIRSADISGSTRLIGDIELNVNTLSKGVFYGRINPEMIANSRWGAERTSPAPEVTTDPLIGGVGDFGCASAMGSPLMPPAKSTLGK
jgi:hypothetical protein